MTREETAKLINAFDLPSKVVADMIHNDFESRICENCKWYRHTGEGVKECKLYDIAFGDTFGCPKFERKEDRTRN